MLFGRFVPMTAFIEFAAANVAAEVDATRSSLSMCDELDLRLADLELIPSTSWFDFDWPLDSTPFVLFVDRFVDLGEWSDVSEAELLD